MKLLIPLMFLVACGGESAPAPVEDPSVIAAAMEAAAEEAAGANEVVDQAAQGAAEAAGDAVEEAAGKAEAGTEAAVEAAAGAVDKAKKGAPESGAKTAETATEVKKADETKKSEAPASEDGIADAGDDAPAAEAPAEVKAPAKTNSYTLTSKGSSLYVQVFKDPNTVAAGLSHDHVMSASGWSGKATWNVDDPSKCSLEVSVPVAKLIVDSPAMRRAVGYEGDLDDGMRADVRKNMLSKKQLNGDAHPNITFKSTSCSAAGGDKYTVKGNLSIRGQSKAISTTLTVSATDSAFEVKGGFSAKASDFGFEPYSAMAGALKNQDKMKFVLRLKGS